MSDKAFDFFNDHSVHFLEMALTTERQEKVHAPDGYGTNTGECGDTVEMFLMVNIEKIERVSFAINGCIHTHACANTVATLSEGKTVQEAWDIGPETVVEFLETLPVDHFHCAELAVGAFYQALRDYSKKRQGLWKDCSQNITSQRKAI